MPQEFKLSKQSKKQACLGCYKCMQQKWNYFNTVKISKPLHKQNIRCEK